MSAAAIDVRKAVAYAVLDAAGARVSVRKAVGYSVLDASVVVSVRKALAYAVLEAGQVSVRKAVAYAVLDDPTITPATGRAARCLSFALGLGLASVPDRAAQ